MNFIKKLFLNKTDKEVHGKFIRFSKGVYTDRAVSTIRVGSKIRISTTFEYSTDLVHFIFSLIEKAKAKGVIITKEEIDFESLGINGEKKLDKKKGIYQITIDQELSKKQFDLIKDKVYVLLLNLNFPEGQLKVKAKLPRAPKGGSKTDDKFCVAVIEKKFLQEVREEFLFDVKENHKVVNINHTFEINEIILPKNTKDFERMRLESKRKGEIIRRITLDGVEKTTKKSFEV